MNDLQKTLAATAREGVSRAGSAASKPATKALLVGGALLGSLAVINALAARGAERRDPPSGGFLDVDGVRVHYLEKGSGDPIVLIHGNGVMAEDWALSGVFDLLARSHRVIAFDRPGFGYTDRPRTRIWTAHAQADLLRTAMSRLGVERATVVGHSFGTLVAMSMALHHPQAVSRLVLMSGYFYPTPRADGPLTGGPAIPVLGDIMRYTISPPLGVLFIPLAQRMLFAPAKAPAKFKEGFPWGLALRPSQIRAAGADGVLMVPEAAKTLRRHTELRMPVLIMSGDGDRIVSFEHQSKALSRELPGSRLETFVGAGHMIHHLAPERVAALIGDPVPELEMAA